MRTRYIRLSDKVGKKRQALIRPEKYLGCCPPYEAGKLDTCWIFADGLNVFSKEECEKAVGMLLLPLEEDKI